MRYFNSQSCFRLTFDVLSFTFTACCAILLQAKFLFFFQKFLDRCTYFNSLKKDKAKAEAKKGYRLKDLANLNLII